MAGCGACNPGTTPDHVILSLAGLADGDKTGCAARNGDYVCNVKTAPCEYFYPLAPQVDDLIFDFEPGELLPFSINSGWLVDIALGSFPQQLGTGMWDSGGTGLFDCSLQRTLTLNFSDTSQCDWSGASLILKPQSPFT